MLDDLYRAIRQSNLFIPLKQKKTYYDKQPLNLSQQFPVDKLLDKLNDLLFSITKKNGHKIVKQNLTAYNVFSYQNFKIHKGQSIRIALKSKH